MARLNKINVFSLAKFQAILLAPVGLIAGIIYSFGGLIYDIITTGTVNFGTALAFFALIAMPVIFAGFGFILGLLEALLYNLFTNRFIRIDLDLENTK